MHSNTYSIILFILLIYTVKNNEHHQKGKISLNSDIKVEDTLIADKIITNKLTSNGSIKSPEISVKKLDVDKLTTNRLTVDAIIAKNGALEVDGNIVLTNEISGNSINIDNSKGQWYLLTHDDFETEESLKGWSNKKVNRCPNDSNRHLGGYCNFAGNKVTKIYNNLPPHKVLRINALYHMIDYWQGEEGYMLVDGVKKWSKRGVTKKNGIDICGGKSADPAFNIKIDVTIKHESDSVELSFGSTLTGDPCLHSFAIDDVMIYTKN